MKDISIKRVYEPVQSTDGVRILVDRLWPRGVSREKAGIAFWFKDIAPSSGLRQWFSHDPEKWDEFRTRYRSELEGKRGMLEEIRRKAHIGNVTLLYAAKDMEHNDAIVLREVLRQETPHRPSGNGI